MGTIFNKDFQLKCYEKTYGVWILDNIFEEGFCETSLTNWPSQSDKRWNKGYANVGDSSNKLEGNMLAMSGKGNIPECFAKVLENLSSKESISFYEKVTSIKGLLADDYGRWSGLRQTLPNGYQLIHSDARKHLDSGLRRELTIIVYFSKNYDRKRDEGCLEIWNEDMTKKTHSIEPLNNRMVILFNSDKSYHGVPVTKFNRKMMTFSLMKRSKATDRFKALFVARPEDDDEIRQLGMERAHMKDRFSKIS